MKITLLFVALVAGVASIGGPLWLSQPPRSDSPGLAKPWNYSPAEVAANGVIEGNRPEVGLRPEVAGQIASILVRENQKVTRGTILAELQNDTHQQEVALAAAELAQAKAQLDKLRNGERKEKIEAAAALESAKHHWFLQAKADCERAKELLPRKSISVEQWDALRYRMLQVEAEWKQAKAENELLRAPARLEDMAAAEARVAMADAQHRLAQAKLAKTRLVAPCDGCVLQVFAEPGEIANPTSLQPVLVFADLSKRRVRAFVEELDVTRVQAGHQAVVTGDALGDKEYTGRVAVVLPRMGKRAPQSDAPGEYRDVHYREVLIDLQTTEEIPINLRVRVRLLVQAGHTPGPVAPTVAAENPK